MHLVGRVAVTQPSFNKGQYSQQVAMFVTTGRNSGVEWLKKKELVWKKCVVWMDNGHVK